MRTSTTIVAVLALASSCARNGGACRPDPEPACEPGKDCPVKPESPPATPKPDP